MKFYHRTNALDAILENGFRDATGTYMTSNEYTGVWISAVPLDANEGASGNFLLSIEIPEDEVAEYEWIEDGKPYREWLVPAELLNRHGPPNVEEIDHGFDVPSEDICREISMCVLNQQIGFPFPAARILTQSIDFADMKRSPVDRDMAFFSDLLACDLVVMTCEALAQYTSGPDEWIHPQEWGHRFMYSFELSLRMLLSDICYTCLISAEEQDEISEPYETKIADESAEEMLEMIDWPRADKLIATRHLLANGWMEDADD